MLTIGLDVHERSTSICILDESGDRVKEVRVDGHPRNTMRWLAKQRRPFQVCFEASTGYGWLHDELIQLAERVVVAHPGKLRLIFRSRRKNDRNDAYRLARLMLVDELPPVHVPPVAVRSWRALIEARNRVVRQRTRTKNGIRALLRTCGIKGPRSLWSKKGLAWFESLELDEDLAVCRDVLLNDLHAHGANTATYEVHLKKLAAKSPAVALLMTIPGVGIRTAEAFVVYTHEPQRFRSRSIGAYLGLVPRQDSSGSVNRMGRITREGPSTVRKMLAEATWQAIRRSQSIRTRFERIQGGRPDRRKKALVATAHHLARVMLAMLKTGEVWREEETVLQAA